MADKSDIVAWSHALTCSGSVSSPSADRGFLGSALELDVPGRGDGLASRVRSRSETRRSKEAPSVLIDGARWISAQFAYIAINSFFGQRAPEVPPRRGIGRVADIGGCEPHRYSREVPRAVDPRFSEGHRRRGLRRRRRAAPSPAPFSGAAGEIGDEQPRKRARLPSSSGRRGLARGLNAPGQGGHDFAASRQHTGDALQRCARERTLATSGRAARGEPQSRRELTGILEREGGAIFRRGPPQVMRPRY